MQSPGGCCRRTKHLRHGDSLCTANHPAAYYVDIAVRIIFVYSVLTALLVCGYDGVYGMLSALSLPRVLARSS